jgi:EAL domain-containing protein (putative c-di-GMP-specific phosphodiesterase class I)/GGDEF domain-containing protein
VRKDATGPGAPPPPAGGGSGGCAPPPDEGPGFPTSEADVVPTFQPIVDLSSASVIGFEVLSRGPELVGPPEGWFAAARKAGRLWEVERICRSAAIRAVAALPAHWRSHRYFLNASPAVLEDPRFVEGFTRALLLSHGLDVSGFVIEITESAAVQDVPAFERAVQHYGAQGFELALDDFGSGHSSLVTLIRTAPQYLKLDMALVRRIDEDVYRQHLVRSLVDFTRAVDGRLVAEGIETWGELETLLRLGVRHGQGFLLGRPAPEPAPLAPELRHRLRRVVRSSRAVTAALDVDDTIAPLVRRATTLDGEGTTVEDLEELFRRLPALDHVVVVDRDGRPTGLVPRLDFATKIAGPFGYSLNMRKPVTAVAKHAPVTVGQDIAVTALASRATARAAADLYDPVVVIEDDGRLKGTVTMKQLLERSVELQLESAQGANPLTGLPGNAVIARWIGRRFREPMATVVYGDLDRFKEYNDRYGFVLGDDMIRLAGQVLVRELGDRAGEGLVGHLGGDDFVVVCPAGIDTTDLERACAAFDEAKLALFDPEDAARGWFVAKDRRGQESEVPLVTLSLAAIDRANLGADLHPALLSAAAASLKAKVKSRNASRGASGYMVERRHHSQPPPGADTSS